MMRKLLKSGVALIMALAFIFTSIPVTAYAADEVNYDSVKEQATPLANLLTSIYAETSVQYALIDDGEIVLSGQAGKYSKTDDRPLHNEHMYGIGSISKMFTSMAVMQLVEKGTVQLDSPVIEYIPEFKMKDERYKNITVRMLLNHSSGLMGSSYNNMMLMGDNNPVSYDELLNTLSTQRLKADPGAFSVYCNDGFSLAQLVVEKVSKVSFTEYISENITEPLGMKHTKTPYDTFDRNQLVKYYLSTKKDLRAENLTAVGAGGIYSTAEDLCLFAQAFMNEGEEKVLTKESAKLMAGKEYLNGFWGPDVPSSLSFGLGWDSVNTYPFTDYGIQAVVKGGDTKGYHGSLIVLPEENMAVAVLSSGGASTYNAMFGQQLLLNALLEKGTITKILDYKTATPPVKASMPSEFTKFSGYYGLMGSVIRIEIDKDGVLGIFSGDSKESEDKVYYAGDGRFYTEDGSYYVSFIEADNGNTYLYAGGYGMIPGLGQVALSEIQIQKLKPNEITDSVKAAWKKREDVKYLLVNQLYSSMGFVIGLSFFSGKMYDGLEGYYESAFIIDKDHAQMQLQIPGNYGRDLYDLEFYTKDKKEYVKVGDMLFVSSKNISKLSTKSSFTVKLDSEGYAKWYLIDSKSKNKKIKVTLPNNSSYSVYKADGTLVYNSITYKESTPTLPSGGYIVFAGSKGAKFSVKYVK